MSEDHPMMATGMEVEGEGPSAGASEEPPVISQSGALPAKLLQMLVHGPRTVNEDGELEELPPAEPAMLAPAFSSDTLAALRAERLARKAAAPPPSSARPATSSPIPNSENAPPKAAKSHRSGTKSPPDSGKDSKKHGSSQPKSHRDSTPTKKKKVHLSMASAEKSSRGVQISHRSAGIAA